MEAITAWVFFSVLAALFAGRRGRSWLGWFLLSLLISPLITVILLFILPNHAEPGLERDESGEVITVKSHVRCPDCRELVRHDARKCKYCGTALIPQ